MKPSRALLILTFFAALGLPLRTNAQEDVSRFDVFGGYNYVRFNVHSNVSTVPPMQSFNADGGSGQFSLNATKWLGLVGDLGGYYVTTPPHAGALSYLVGPRVSFRCGFFTPFAQTTFGGLAATGGVGQAGVQNHFAMTVGGGMEFNVSENVAIRPLQADYFMTKFPDGLNNRQNNFRFGTGVVFRFGRT